MKYLLVIILALAIVTQCLGKSLEEEIVDKLKDNFELAKDKSTNLILIERMGLRNKPTFEKLKEKLGLSTEEHYIVQMFQEKLGMKRDEFHLKLLRDFLYENIPVVLQEKKTLLEKVKEFLGLGGLPWQTKLRELLIKNFVEWKELTEETKEKLVEKTKDKAEDLKEKAKEKLESAKEKSTEFLHECKDKCGEKLSEWKEKASDIKETVEEKAEEVKEKWVEKKEQIKKALGDVKGMVESSFEGIFSLRELRDHLQLNDDEKLTLSILERRLGKSGMLTIGEFIDYYGPQNDIYFTLTPAEKQVVDRITDYFLSLREKPDVVQLKKNIGGDKSWREKLTEIVEDEKQKTDNLKNSLKQSIGLSKTKESTQRNVEL